MNKYRDRINAKFINVDEAKLRGWRPFMKVNLSDIISLQISFNPLVLNLKVPIWKIQWRFLNKVMLYGSDGIM